MSDWIKAIYRNNGGSIGIDNAPRESGRYLVTCYVKGTNGVGFYTDTAYYSRLDNTWMSSDMSRMMSGIVAYMDSPSAFVCDDVIEAGDVIYSKKKPLYIDSYFHYNIMQMHETISLNQRKSGKYEVQIASYCYQDNNLEDVVLLVNLIEKDGSFSIRMDKMIAKIIVESISYSGEMFDDKGILRTAKIKERAIKYSEQQVEFAEVLNFNFVSHIKEKGYDDICEELLTVKDSEVVLTEASYQIKDIFPCYLIEGVVKDNGDDLRIILNEYLEDKGAWKLIHSYPTSLCLEDIYMNLATNLEKESRIYAGVIH